MRMTPLLIVPVGLGFAASTLVAASVSTGAPGARSVGVQLADRPVLESFPGSARAAAAESVTAPVVSVDPRAVAKYIALATWLQAIPAATAAQAPATKPSRSAERPRKVRARTSTHPSTSGDRDAYWRARATKRPSHSHHRDCVGAPAAMIAAFEAHLVGVRGGTLADWCGIAWGEGNWQVDPRGNRSYACGLQVSIGLHTRRAGVSAAEARSSWDGCARLARDVMDNQGWSAWQ